MDSTNDVEESQYAHLVPSRSLRHEFPKVMQIIITMSTIMNIGFTNLTSSFAWSGWIPSLICVFFVGVLQLLADRAALKTAFVCEDRSYYSVIREFFPERVFGKVVAIIIFLWHITMGIFAFFMLNDKLKTSFDFLSKCGGVKAAEWLG